MLVRELMHILASMPQDAEVKGVYDGVSRLDIKTAWPAQSGDVLLAGEDCYLYYEEDFPPEGEFPEIDRRPI